MSGGAGLRRDRGPGNQSSALRVQDHPTHFPFRSQSFRPPGPLGPRVHSDRLGVRNPHLWSPYSDYSHPGGGFGGASHRTLYTGRRGPVPGIRHHSGCPTRSEGTGGSDPLLRFHVPGYSSKSQVPGEFRSGPGRVRCRRDSGATETRPATPRESDKDQTSCLVERTEMKICVSMCGRECTPLTKTDDFRFSGGSPCRIRFRSTDRSFVPLGALGLSRSSGRGVRVSVYDKSRDDPDTTNSLSSGIFVSLSSLSSCRFHCPLLGELTHGPSGVVVRRVK